MHRETPIDFWITVAVVISLFVPIWGVLLAPSQLINAPLYLAIVGGIAFLIVVGALIYGEYHNRVFVNRFLYGYLGGLIGTAIVHVFMEIGTAMDLMPSMINALGNLALGRGLQDQPSTLAYITGTAYHYLLNGAAWGAVYALIIGKARWWYGVFYGIGIWAILMVSPVFYALDFPQAAAGRGPLLIILMLIAHLLYGGAIGYTVYRFAFPEVGVEGSKAIRPIYG